MVLVPTVVQAQPVHDGNFIDNVQIALLNEAKGRGYSVNTISDLTVGTGILENTSTSPEALAQEIADVFFPVRNTSSDSLEISEKFLLVFHCWERAISIKILKLPSLNIR